MVIHLGQELGCKICDFKTKYRNILISHMMRIHGCDMEGKLVDRTYKCDICDYAGFTLYEFNMHKQKHTADRPFKCPICNFGSVDRGTLTKHLRTHTGETPFSCNICSKTFTQQSGLARHKRIHLGVKPHKCTVCGKLYADKKSLDTHMFKHDNIKPFICHICSYGCVRKDVLLKHIAKTHGEGSVPQDLIPKRTTKRKQVNPMKSDSSILPEDSAVLHESSLMVPEGQGHLEGEGHMADLTQPSDGTLHNMEMGHEPTHPIEPGHGQGHSIHLDHELHMGQSQNRLAVDPLPQPNLRMDHLDSQIQREISLRPQLLPQYYNMYQPHSQSHSFPPVVSPNPVVAEYLYQVKHLE